VNWVLTVPTSFCRSYWVKLGKWSCYGKSENTCVPVISFVWHCNCASSFSFYFTAVINFDMVLLLGSLAACPDAVSIFTAVLSLHIMYKILSYVVSWFSDRSNIGYLCSCVYFRWDGFIAFYTVMYSCRSKQHSRGHTTKMSIWLRTQLVLLLRNVGGKQPEPMKMQKMSTIKWKRRESRKETAKTVVMTSQQTGWLWYCMLHDSSELKH